MTILWILYRLVLHQSILDTVDVTNICRGGMKIAECRHHLDQFENINAESDLTIFIIGSNDMSRYRRAQDAALACAEDLQINYT